MNDKVSIIVIIYKNETFIRECLDSIVRQTYKDIEIICVVGKGDKACEDIVDEYAAEDDRFVVIKAEPRGTADARNKGLDAVTGDYIAFVDGDDRISDDMIEVMLGAAKQNQTDISVVGKFYLYENCTDGTEENREQVLGISDAFKVILYQEGFFLHLWDKLYKKELFDGVRFPEGKLVEDRQMAAKILLKADRLVYNSASKYYFRVSEDSGSKVEENLRLSLKADHEICDELKKRFDDIGPAVEFFLVNENLSVIQNSFLYGNFSKEHDREYLEYVKAHAPAVKNDPRVPKSLKIKMDMCNISPYLFKRVTLARRKKFLKTHVAFKSGVDWNATFKEQGVNTSSKNI
ncbi:MAG: glycosyltransferase family 2 protein [Lachnospiraceae bacterium]|nr:glycosyltransferase family 2 protein [Lachnospiraceae bacterium]